MQVSIDQDRPEVCVQSNIKSVDGYSTSTHASPVNKSTERDLSTASIAKSHHQSPPPASPMNSTNPATISNGSSTLVADPTSPVYPPSSPSPPTISHGSLSSELIIDKVTGADDDDLASSQMDIDEPETSVQSDVDMIDTDPLLFEEDDQGDESVSGRSEDAPAKSPDKVIVLRRRSALDDAAPPSRSVSSQSEQEDDDGKDASSQSEQDEGEDEDLYEEDDDQQQQKSRPRPMSLPSNHILSGMQMSIFEPKSDMDSSEMDDDRPGSSMSVVPHLRHRSDSSTTSTSSSPPPNSTLKLTRSSTRPTRIAAQQQEPFTQQGQHVDQTMKALHEEAHSHLLNIEASFNGLRDALFERRYRNLGVEEQQIQSGTHDDYVSRLANTRKAHDNRVSQAKALYQYTVLTAQNHFDSYRHEAIDTFSDKQWQFKIDGIRTAQRTLFRIKAERRKLRPRAPNVMTDGIAVSSAMEPFVDQNMSASGLATTKYFLTKRRRRNKALANDLRIIQARWGLPALQPDQLAPTEIKSDLESILRARNHLTNTFPETDAGYSHQAPAGPVSNKSSYPPTTHTYQDMNQSKQQQVPFGHFTQPVPKGTLSSSSTRSYPATVPHHQQHVNHHPTWRTVPPPPPTTQYTETSAVNYHPYNPPIKQQSYYPATSKSGHSLTGSFTLPIPGSSHASPYAQQHFYPPGLNSPPSTKIPVQHMVRCAHHAIHYFGRDLMLGEWACVRDGLSGGQMHARYAGIQADDTIWTCVDGSNKRIPILSLMNGDQILVLDSPPQVSIHQSTIKVPKHGMLYAPPLQDPTLTSSSSSSAAWASSNVPPTAAMAPLAQS